MLDEITLSIITACVIGLVQLAKNIGLDSKWAGLLAVLLGIVGTLGLAYYTTFSATIFTGIVVGLSAAGIYSTGKKLVK